MTTAVDSNQTRGNLLGVSAILLWSTMTSLMRLLSETFGATAGAALMYTVATIVLALMMGWPSLRQFPVRYLVIVGSLFVAYEVALFFALASVLLWSVFAFSDETLHLPDLRGGVLLLATGAIIALGYAAWNKALRSGNLMMLAAISYTAPVLSSLFSSVILSTALRISFWQGALLVTLGSLECRGAFPLPRPLPLALALCCAFAGKARLHGEDRCLAGESATGLSRAAHTIARPPPVLFLLWLDCPESAWNSPYHAWLRARLGAALRALPGSMRPRALAPPHALQRRGRGSAGPL